MTKRKLTPQQQLRLEIDKTVTAIIDRAQAMIAADVPVVLAFRLAISFELECYQYEVANKAMIKLLAMKFKDN